MPELLLTNWSKVEIFCKVVSKDKPELMRKLKSNDEIIKMLETYKGKEKCRELSAKVFKEKSPRKVAGKDEDSDTSFPLFFYDLRTAILKGRPFYIDTEILVYIEKYLIEKLELVGQDSAPWNASQKIRQFENTRWCGYFGNKKVTSDGDVRKGISRLIVNFKMFGKIEISNFYLRDGKAQDYIGNFDIHPQSDEIIKANLRLKGSNEKDLRIMLYVGKHDTDLAIGVWSNIGTELSCGTMLIDRESAKSRGTIKPRFFDLQIEEDRIQVPVYVREFFEVFLSDQVLIPYGAQTISSLNTVVQQQRHLANLGKK